MTAVNENVKLKNSVCLFMIVCNYDADLEVSDTCVRSSLLSRAALTDSSVFLFSFFRIKCSSTIMTNKNTKIKYNTITHAHTDTQNYPHIHTPPHRYNHAEDLILITNSQTRSRNKSPYTPESISRTMNCTAAVNSRIT